jgi:hypothetical protein
MILPTSSEMAHRPLIVIGDCRPPRWMHSMLAVFCGSVCPENLADPGSRLWMS